MEDVMTKGVGHVKEAVIHDQAGRYVEALKGYELGLDSFVLVLKYERNDRVRNTLEAKIKEYLDRAEAIKKILSGKSPTSANCALPHATSPPPRLLFPPSSSSSKPANKPPSNSPTFSNNNNNFNNNNNNFNNNFSSPPPLPQSGTHAASLRIRQGQIGCSYDSLFGKYLFGASVIAVEDPYIRADHQIQNFVRFCELVAKRTNCDCLIHLMTSAESPAQRSSIENNFNFIKSSLSSLSPSSSDGPVYSVQLVLTFSDTLHDRAIRLNNGWVIKIGRGLDIYAKPQNKFCVGNFDLDFRPCLETSVDIFKETN